MNINEIYQDVREGNTQELDIEDDIIQV